MPTTNTIEYRKTDDKSIVEDKLPINEEKKKNMFKGTVAICVVYGAFALILLFSTAFNSAMRDILFNRFLPFTLIFIVGTILIILFMLYFIFSYVPVIVPNIDKDDNISCPDYWKVEILDDNVISQAFDPNYPKYLFKYKCVMDDKIYDKKQLFKSSNNPGIGMRYTNIFSNIVNTGATGDTNNGMYNTNTSSGFEANYNNYSNLANLYVNLNYFDPTYIRVGSSANQAIGNYINTNSPSIMTNVFSNLEEISYLHNNYKFTNTDKTQLQDILSTSNIYSKNPNVLSPIAWQYDNFAATTSSNYGLATTSSTEYSNINSMILNWNELTPEKAFNVGINMQREEPDTEDLKTRHLYVYYNKTVAPIGKIYLGDITITSNAKLEPKYNMVYKTNGNIGTTIGTNVANLESILDGAKIEFHNVTSAATSATEITNNINANMKPTIQLYNKTTQRPSSIAKRANVK
jgi:hypothetical protein